ncbi:MAG: InlB B-repeat-containing protein [Clostridia bacterium]|nr:InlB B-repeat-containing protein [Clostridia bacterium]
MKHKLKGLISLWMAIALIAAMIVPAAAEEYANVYVYKGTAALTRADIDNIDNMDDTQKAKYFETYTDKYSVDYTTTLDTLVADENFIASKPKYASELLSWKTWNIDCGNFETYSPQDFSDYAVGAHSNTNFIHEPIWKDGRAITKQPTAADPSIKVNYPEGVTYQWYEKGEIVVPVKNINEVASTWNTYFKDETGKYSEWVNHQYRLDKGTPTNSDGVFESVYNNSTSNFSEVAITIDLLLDWVVRVSADSDVTVQDYNVIYGYGNTPSLTFTSDSSYHYGTVTDATRRAHNVHCFNRDGEFTAKIEVLIPEYVPVDGATSARLTNGVDGKEYYCVATWPDGYSLTSESFIYEDNTGDGERRLSGFFMLMLLTRRVIYYDGEEQVEYTRVKKGETAEEYVPEAKEGMVFDGWYTDKELTEKFDFTTEIYESVNLYAKWLTEEEAAAAAAEAEKAEAEAGTAAEDEATTETEANTEA